MGSQGGGSGGYRDDGGFKYGGRFGDRGTDFEFQIGGLVRSLQPSARFFVDAMSRFEQHCNLLFSPTAAFPPAAKELFTSCFAAVIFSHACMPAVLQCSALKQGTTFSFAVFLRHFLVLQPAVLPPQ